MYIFTFYLSFLLSALYILKVGGRILIFSVLCFKDLVIWLNLCYSTYHYKSRLNLIINPFFFFFFFISKEVSAYSYYRGSNPKLSPELKFWSYWYQLGFLSLTSIPLIFAILIPVVKKYSRDHKAIKKQKAWYKLPA